MEDAQEHNMLIEIVHVLKEEEVRANLATPMNEGEMPDYVLEKYKETYPRLAKEVNAIQALTGKKRSSSTDEMEELLGFHAVYLDLL